VSVKDLWVGPHEQVLNVPIACRCYGSDKPSSLSSTEGDFTPSASMAVDCVGSPFLGSIGSVHRC
jgi:hypothetical protein